VRFTVNKTYIKTVGLLRQLIMQYDCQMAQSFQTISLKDNGWTNRRPVNN